MKCTFVFLLVALVMGSIFATIHYVPFPNIDITSALMISAPGDTIFVMPAYNGTVEPSYPIIINVNNVTIVGDSSAYPPPVIVAEAPVPFRAPVFSILGPLVGGLVNTGRLAWFTIQDGSSGIEINGVMSMQRYQIDHNYIWNNHGNAGGGIYMTDSDPRIWWNSINDNSAVMDGGGINGVRSPAIIETNDICRNTAGRNGGGAFIEMTTGGNFMTNWMNHNMATDGGGVFWDRTDMPINANSIDTNHAYNNGGGIYLKESIPIVAADTMRANCADVNGGGMFIDELSVPTVHDNYFIVDTARADGGGIYLNGGLAIPGPLVSFTDNEISGCRAESDGGGFYMGDNTSSTWTDNMIMGNSAAWGATGKGGGGYIGSDTRATFCSNYVVENYAFYGGGYAFNGASFTPVTVVADTFIGNQADTSGGGNWINQASVIYDTCAFYGNIAIHGIGGTGGGGIAAFDPKTLSICDSDIDNNLAIGGNGGGMMLYCIKGATILRNYFTANSAMDAGGVAGNGGGIYSNGDDDTYQAIVANNLFFSNSADLSGGGMFIMGGASFTVANNDFIADSCDFLATGREGGGIYNATFGIHPGKPDIHSNCFYDNYGPTVKDIYLGLGATPRVEYNRVDRLEPTASLPHMVTGPPLYESYPPAPFTYPTFADLHPNLHSCLIDLGDTSGLTVPPPWTDLDLGATDIGLWGGPYASSMGRPNFIRGLTATAGVGFVCLTWNSATFAGPSTAVAYAVYCSTGADFSPVMANGFYPSFVDTSLDTTYNHITATPGVTYYYRVHAFVLADSIAGGYSDTASSVLLGITDFQRLPATTAITAIVPNPANPSCCIAYSVTSADRTVLDIFDMNGRLVRNIDLGCPEVGEHRVLWNGENDRGRALPSGIYLVKLESGIVSDTRKILLLR